jgi:hypothetical protein
LIWQDDFLLNLIEIKASETIMPDMFKGLTYYDNLDAVSVQSKMLMHTGNFTQERALGKVESWINIDGI